MNIRGIEHWNAVQLHDELARGGRFVFYEYCISLLFLTLRRPSAVWFVPAGQLGFARGLRYTVLSLLVGWWGLPWGIVYTPLVVLTNLMGGRDVTAEVRPLLLPEPL